ncbi:zinc-dependent metalloprotease [Galbibacter pacificus]|uniref:Zinc-dependent metalloprotease n=1 Tax=Galbibacter pacificus TaxID=2996052 RepID=A0ABT6FS86_9FLAO|nr:zinc-dependent metalloprotease [Galbibacter pacificus]MDG3582755.1 zinc-dependent metalloprotease [Galbibacter pacificus]MDG3586126.1 zinc-dependent metalloprotease [Galbibacter pacificus]
MAQSTPEGLSFTPAEPYEEVIPENAQTKKGLFDVHKVNDHYYFEIPDTLLSREILVVTRFVKTPGGAGNYGGEEIGERTIFFEKGPSNKIFLRIATFVSHADKDDAIAKAVQNSNITPILEAFDVKARNKDNNASVIEVTDFINSENNLLALSSGQKETYNLTSLEKDKSYIKEINTYPINTEVKTVKTYKAKVSHGNDKNLQAAILSGVVTVELNNSFILLPKNPMQKRLYDPRVGYFASSYLEYGDNQQKVNKNIYIHRWRLEPRPEDMEKWKNGELVVPKKQIVYYIDPATPKKWRPYLIQGINDWQKAFEQAGFKNAIIGKEWPVNNDTMSLEDARYSVLRYFASPSKNAYGPNIIDPRSGEILESHMGWYHNLMNLLHNWYMVQAGAVDERARKMTYDDELMGELIRFVSSHEVGHTLGLRHNMGASYATPVERLRDNDWLTKHGHTSSIMDYARFNYVAQPEDSVEVKNLMPRIGDYDKWAIQWGYSKFPVSTTSEEEKEILNKWVIDSIAANPRLWFGGEGRDFDPRSQTEDLGDNAMVASYYGIKNLQRILPNLAEWTEEKGSDNYQNLDEIYQDVIKQYNNYLFHVAKNIGGIYVTPKSREEDGDVYRPVSKAKQKEALMFLNKYVFTEPAWLLNDSILNKVEQPKTKDPVTNMMESMMLTLIGGSRMSRMSFIAERYNFNDPYTPEEYLNDVSAYVWSDLDIFYNPSDYERKLQKTYVADMIALYDPDKAQGPIAGLMARLSEETTSNTDIRSLALNNLITIQQKIKRVLPRVSNSMAKAHLLYLAKEIDDVVGETPSFEREYRPITD